MRLEQTRRVFLLLLVGVLSVPAQSLRFGVIGDSGSGAAGQWAVARQMETFEKAHPWEFVLMLGDNIYEDGNPRDFDRKFKKVYRNLMAAGVRFHATLGGHDRRNPTGRKGMVQVEDDAFGFVGHQDEYVFAAGPRVHGKVLARFICLNSEAWIEEIHSPERIKLRLDRLRVWLSESNQFQWNFLFMHNPLYSFTVAKSVALLFGRWGHGPEDDLRLILEPELLGKVDIALAGHEHFYQKIRPQNGIDYWISGGGSKIRRGIKRDPQVEFAAEVLHFLDFEVSETEVKYAAISDKGVQIHSGGISKTAPATVATPTARRAGQRWLAACGAGTCWNHAPN